MKTEKGRLRKEDWKRKREGRRRKINEREESKWECRWKRMKKDKGNIGRIKGREKCKIERNWKRMKKGGVERGKEEWTREEMKQNEKGSR